MSEGPGRQWASIYHRLKHDLHDREAIAALFALVTSWARRDVANVTDREDVVAETCAEVLLKLDRAYGPLTFDGFVRGSYLNALKNVRQRGTWSAMPLDSINVPAPQADNVSPDELELLQHCLAQLTARLRRAVELRYFQGASTQEMARALKVSIENARQLVSRGLKALRECARRTWPQGREWPL